MEYLTVTQAAARLGMSRNAVYRLCSRERPAIRHCRVGAAGSTIRIPDDAIEEYIEAATVEPWAAPRAEPPPPRRFLRESDVR